MIQALIFDFDGLILDTEVPDFVSWQEIYEEHGCALDREAWCGFIGTQSGSFKPFDSLEASLGRTLDQESIQLRRKQRYLELIEKEVALPGVEDYLRTARRLGLRIGVASSSSHGWVATHLTRLGLLSSVELLRCSDDVRAVKPDPELYQCVLDHWNLRAEEAVAFEDSLNGIRAAKAAGIFCVAVPNAMTRDLPLQEADLLLPSLKEMSLEALLAEVEAKRDGWRGG